MNILHIYQGDYPWDVRVEKINETLIEEGHNISLLCRNIGRQKLVEKKLNLTIYRLPYLPAIFKGLNSMFNYPFFINPVWKQNALRICRFNNIGLIIVRDLPLGLLGIWLGKKIDVPVIMDMAENYPCMFEARIQCSKFNPLNYFIRSPTLARVIEGRVFKIIDKIFVVIEESRERLLSLGVDPDKIVIVRNTAPDSVYTNKSIPLPDDDFFYDDNSVVLLYNGITNPARGILDFVKKMPKVLNKCANVKLVIIGKGKDDREIKKAIEKLGIEKSVHHKGWVSHEDKLKYLKHSDIGIIPYFITSHWNTTIPNKIFDYMCMGKPVLCTEIIPSARIVRKCKCGQVYRQDSVLDLCEKLEVLSDPEERKVLGENGYKMVLRKYHWNKDKQNIVKTVNELTGVGYDG